jgi:membrane-bound ClpP family serine protease
MSSKEIALAPAAIVGSATAVTEAATFDAQHHTASYTQHIDAALSMINLSLDCPL